MVDRTIPFGDPANAEYFTGEGGADPPDGNFVVAETAAGTKLMEYDATASEWVVRGDVNMSGQALAVDSVDANSVSTDEANVTGETYVESVLGSTNSGVSAGTWVTVADSEQEDARDEYTGQKLAPDKSGYYEITGIVAFSGISDGDQVRARVRNVTDGNTVDPWIFNLPTSTSNDHYIPFTCKKELSAGKEYEIQATNGDSSFDLSGGSGIAQSGYTIERQVVHA